MSGSCTVDVDSEIGVTKHADAGNDKEAAAGSFTFEIADDVNKAEHKEAAAGKGVVTEEAWIEFVFPRPPVAKERVPDYVMDRLREKLPFRKLPPIDFTLPGSDVDMFPKLRDGYLSNMARWNYLVDLHTDCLKQQAEKGFAEVGVDFTDGAKKIFILPQHH